MAKKETDGNTDNNAQLLDRLRSAIRSVRGGLQTHQADDIRLELETIAILLEERL